MQVAIEKARYGVQNGQSPFGACVVKNGEVISSGSNTVWKDG
ncbi:nucleoside deaminase, partial [candidate division WOR-3 bacterium]|nr:nucleoside deaminase [candidate division WOR-3 bacterium]